MTVKLIVLVLSLLGDFYSIILNIIRYCSSNNSTPANVADVYDAETYENWRAYSAETCKLAIAENIVSMVISFVLLLTNAFSEFAILYPSEEDIWEAVAVVLLIVLSDFVTGTVFGYISTMVIEQKYGFNRSTLKTFIGDRIRSLIASTFIMSGLAVLAVSAMRMVQNSMLIALGFFSAGIFVANLMQLVMTPIMRRLVNKFTPLEDGELKTKLMSLLEKHGYRVKAIEVMDASKRTTKANAYFQGLGKQKRIVLYDNLLNTMTEEEICAVFAHEMGHGLHKDIARMRIISTVQMFLMCLVAYIVIQFPSIYEEFGFDGVNGGFAIILVGILLSLMKPLMDLFINAFSRKAEYRADRQAVSEGYGEAMICALKKLARSNFSRLAPSKVNVVLEYSHPPVNFRIDAIEKAMREQTKMTTNKGNQSNV